MKTMFNILISEKAKDYLKNKINSDEFLEIDLKNHGCAGFKVDFNIKKINSSVKIKTVNQINVFIREEQKKYFNNALIDIKNEGLNKKLILDNPNVEITCGCGESINFKKDIK